MSLTLDQRQALLDAADALAKEHLAPIVTYGQHYAVKWLRDRAGGAETYGRIDLDPPTVPPETGLPPIFENPVIKGPESIPFGEPFTFGGGGAFEVAEVRRAAGARDQGRLDPARGLPRLRRGHPDLGSAAAMRRHETVQVPDSQAEVDALLSERWVRGWELVTNYHRSGPYLASRDTVYFVFRERWP